MDPFLNFLSRNTAQNDPLLKMFLQAKESKDSALDYLDREASMGDLAREFSTFYSYSLDAVDDLFLENFNQKCKITSSGTSKNHSPGKIVLSETSNNHLLEANNYREKLNNDDLAPTSGIKRLKLSGNEYIEKLLIGFGYQGDLAPSTAPQTERKSLPISDERILIKLQNPKAKVHRNFSPSTSGSLQANTQMEILNEGEPESQVGFLTSTTQTQSQDTKKIVDLSFLQGEISVKKNSNWPF